MKKMTICCVIAVVLIVVLVILLYVLFHYRIVMNPFGTTYKMIHDHETKAWVEDHLGVIFPDSIDWEHCDHIDYSWDGVFTFCAKFSIPEKDFKTLVPSDIDFEHFQNDRWSLSVGDGRPMKYFKVFEDAKKLNDFEVLRYNENGHTLFFVIDRVTKLPHDRIMVYICSSGYGTRLGKSPRNAFRVNQQENSDAKQDE